MRDIIDIDGKRTFYMGSMTTVIRDAWHDGMTDAEAVIVLRRSHFERTQVAEYGLDAFEAVKKSVAPR